MFRPRAGAVHAPTAGRARSYALIGAWAVLVIVVLWLSLRGYDSFQVGTYRDDAQYVILARSLAFGDSYALDYRAGPPRSPKHPFGFPLLLAPVVWLWPEQPGAGRAISLVATLTNVTLLFWGWPLLARRASRWQGPGVAALYGLSPLVIGHSHLVMTEAIFTTFALATLLLGEHRARNEHSGWSSTIALGCVLAGALFTRWLGFALAIALVVRLATSRPRPPAARALVAPFLVVCGIFAAVVRLTPIRLADVFPSLYVREIETRWVDKAAPTTDPPRSAVQRAAKIVARPTVEAIRMMLVPLGGGEREEAFARRIGVAALPGIISAVVTAVVLLGVWESYRWLRLSSIALLFELFYATSLLAWSRPSPRLLYAIQPFLAWQLLLGVGWLARHATASRRARSVCMAGAWVALVAMSAYKSSVVVDSRQFVGDFRIGTQWLKTHSAPGAVVMAHETAVVHLYAARKTENVPRVATADDLERFIEARGIDYVYIGPRLEWFPEGKLRYDADQLALLALLRDLAQRGRLEAAYESLPHKVIVYRVIPVT